MSVLRCAQVLTEPSFLGFQGAVMLTCFALCNSSWMQMHTSEVQQHKAMTSEGQARYSSFMLSNHSCWDHSWVPTRSVCLLFGSKLTEAATEGLGACNTVTVCQNHRFILSGPIQLLYQVLLVEPVGFVFCVERLRVLRMFICPASPCGQILAGHESQLISVMMHTWEHSNNDCTFGLMAIEVW